MELKLTLLTDGYCIQWERLAIQKGRFRRIHFASMFALIEHPRFGPVLFDTGYTNRFLKETEAFPNRIYRWITPIRLKDGFDVITQLRIRGIKSEDVRHVIVSHFHADHIGGLNDFPNATFYCNRTAFNSIHSLRGLKAIRKAYLPGLMPPDFKDRVVFAETTPLVRLPESHAPYTQAHDLLGDGSLLSVNLPGHAVGQLGIFLTTSSQQDCLLAADACWLSRSYRENLLPHAVVRLLVDWPAYSESLEKLHQLYHSNPRLRIIPSHCEEIWKAS